MNEETEMLHPGYSPRPWRRTSYSFVQFALFSWPKGIHGEIALAVRCQQFVVSYNVRTNSRSESVLLCACDLRHLRNTQIRQIVPHSHLTRRNLA
jgi:hypothetical protein